MPVNPAFSVGKDESLMSYLIVVRKDGVIIFILLCLLVDVFGIYLTYIKVNYPNSEYY